MTAQKLLPITREKSYSCRIFFVSRIHLAICICFLLLGYMPNLSSQHEFLDKDFAVNGTLSFDLDDGHYYVRLLGTDSLENLYLLKYKSGGTFNQLNAGYALAKYNVEGELLFEIDSLGIDAESTSYIVRENRIIQIERTGSAFSINPESVIETYDLNFNLLGRFVIPELVFPVNVDLLSNGGIVGIVSSNIIFKYDPNGFLDTNFAENGFLDLDDIFSGLNSEYYFLDWNLLQDGSMMMSGNYYDSVGISIKIHEDGYLDSSYGNEGIVLHDFNQEIDFPYIRLIEESDNGNIFISGHSDNTNAEHLQKVDKSGLTLKEFGQNGLLAFPPDSGVHYFLGELSNGNLVYKLDQGSSGDLEFDIKLMNKNGEQQYVFGMNSKLSISGLPGQAFDWHSVMKFDDNLFVTKFDSSEVSGSSYGKVHISKIRGDYLIDNNPTETTFDIEFKFYPNPAMPNSRLTYRGPELENISIRILDMQGQLIETLSVSALIDQDQVPISVESYPNGPYFIQIESESETIWSSKILKTNSN